MAERFFLFPALPFSACMPPSARHFLCGLTMRCFRLRADPAVCSLIVTSAAAEARDVGSIAARPSVASTLNLSIQPLVVSELPNPGLLAPTAVLSPEKIKLCALTFTGNDRGFVSKLPSCGFVLEELFRHP